MIEKTIDFLNTYNNFAVFTHLNPDGDALGSAFSITAGLRELNHNATVFLFAPIPYKYRFKEFDSLHLTFEDFNNRNIEACISVDCADIKRLGAAYNIFKNYPSLNIDHHMTNNKYGDINYLSPAPATGEIIYNILKYLGSPFSKAEQIGIYMAIAADTGNFTFPNTSKSSFDICAKMIGMGLQVSEIAEQIFNMRTLPATLLIGLYIKNLRLFHNNKVSISNINLVELKHIGASSEDCEGLINFGRDINTVDLAIFIREIKNEVYKISLRSKKEVDVTKIATRFGGGGHKNAAGCTLLGNFDDVMQTMIDISGEYIY